MKHQSVTEGAIETMVYQFYKAVRQDSELGPIFQAVIADDWDRHLQLMCDFWSSVLLTSRRYYGNPFRAHLMIQNLSPEHFGRWLALFQETLDEVFVPEVGQDIYARANLMAKAIQNRLKDPGVSPAQYV